MRPGKGEGRCIGIVVLILQRTRTSASKLTWPIYLHTSVFNCSPLYTEGYKYANTLFLYRDARCRAPLMLLMNKPVQFKQHATNLAAYIQHSRLGHQPPPPKRHPPHDQKPRAPKQQTPAKRPQRIKPTMIQNGASNRRPNQHA